MIIHDLPLKLRDFPENEKPRERLLQYGAENLANNELLAILLRTGTKKESVMDLSNRLLHSFEGLRLLKEASVEELSGISGIGLVKAVQILAAMELGSRIHKFANEEKYVVRSPEDGANFVMEDMRFLTQEHFVCLYLNTKNEVIHKRTIFIGSLNSSIVHPREVFKEAFKRSAASFICIHNHPSGDPTPSREDIEVTRRLFECGNLIGIELLDHLVIGDKKFVSLKEKGYL
ncbi:RadC family protein [Bacillus atrophaeus]|uniref:RadC family protein n=1 Tax=Bacillus atrophaeus TaxID=1452 RepID=UPI0022811915|nr:DNA repair protein RadC [Bacillus atrophaeus]MCY8959410.1 DNA repair protein RadC [Bacillus atrophaeus]MCY8963115.1 DNA repair protein RadC [Bacillus atrophaeus]MCY9437801.1 DNA repair protein RadC [Bacillus atrophaeus]MEC0651610.1 DNA repair protein RadC [Bacillus atrophaeus]